MRLAIPFVLAQVLLVGMGTVAVLACGRYSTEHLAGLSLASTFFTPLLLFGAAFFSVLQSIIAHLSNGNNDNNEAERVLGQGFLLAIAFSLVGLLIVIAMLPCMLLLPISDLTRILAQDNLLICTSGLPAIYAFQVLRARFDGLSKPSIGFIALGIGFLVNALGCYILVFGKLGLPELGLHGAGIAFSASSWTSLLTIIVFCIRDKTFKWQRQYFKLHKAHMKELLTLGTPAGVGFVLEALFFSLFSFLMGYFGDQALATNNIVLNCAAITFMLALGISLALTTRVGEALGKGDSGKAQQVAYSGIISVALIMCITAAAFLLIPRQILSIYTEDVGVLSLGVPLLMIAGLFQIFDGVQVAAVGALKGYKDTRIPLIINILSYWLVGLSVGLWLAFKQGYGPKGLWIGFVVGLGVAAIGHSIRLRIISKRANHKPI